MPPVRRLYVAPTEFAGETLALADDRARRLLAVLRLPVGATLHVFDGLGHERLATLVEAARGRAVLAFGAALDPLPEPPLAIALCCAFPRGTRGDWLVEKATELGVTTLVPLEADRTVMRPGDGRLDRWRRIAIEAAEQSGRAVVPTFEEAPPEGALALVADFGAARAPADALARATDASAVALYVGPEGGWSDAERAHHAMPGYVPVSLGPRVLRVETAALALLTLTVDALNGRPAEAF